MERSGRRFVVRVLAILLGAAPFAFALIRWFRTGDDLRYLWVAVAAMLGASILPLVATGRNRKSAVFVGGVVAVVVATICGGVTARLVSRSTAPVAWLVAFAFGVCASSSRAFALISQP